MTIEHEIRDAIMDATVIDTRTGAEVDGISDCYVVLASSIDGTLPSGHALSIEWGPSETRHKRAIANAPAWAWEAATEGRLVLEAGRVAIADKGTHR